MLLERLLQSKDLKTKKNFLAPKQRNGTFTVHHYADSVSYHVEEFCEKNKDLLVGDVVTMMKVPNFVHLICVFRFVCVIAFRAIQVSSSFVYATAHSVIITSIVMPHSC
jgi:myosin heavy subunit